MDFDMIGQVAQVGNQPYLRAVTTERERDRISGVMRNGEGVHFNVADGEKLAGADGLDATKALAELFGQDAVERVKRGLGYVQRRFPQSENLRQTAAMVQVFVGDEDTIEMTGFNADGGEARESFALAEAGVNEEAGALGLEQSDVARASRGQNGDAQADRCPPSESMRFGG